MFGVKLKVVIDISFDFDILPLSSFLLRIVTLLSKDFSNEIF